MIAIYTSRIWLPTPDTIPVHLLYPVWGPHIEQVYQSASVYDEYSNRYHELFIMVDEMADAELVIVPADYKHYRKHNCVDLVREIIDESKKLDRWVILFYKSDQDDLLDLVYDRLLIFRTSFYKSAQLANEFAMPVWSGDVRREAERFGISWDGAKDSISFCGQGLVNKGIKRWLARTRYDLVKMFAHSHFCSNHFLSQYYSLLREDVLQRLESSGFSTNFIVRNSYFAGAWRGWGKFDMKTYVPARKEYLENMFQSRFVVCVRGGGNYSLRFYETLAAGRIPILVDTDCVLPFESQINWEDHCVRVSIKDLAQIDKRIKGWVDKQSSLEQVGARNRKLWEDWLTPEGFFCQVHDSIREGIGED